MRFDEFVDIPILHPLRCHRKLMIAHCNSQQWQHVRVAESFPRHNLLAEPLGQPAWAAQHTLSKRLRELTFVILPNSLVE